MAHFHGQPEGAGGLLPTPQPALEGKEFQEIDGESNFKKKK